MKTKMLIILLILAAVLLTASIPAPKQILTGTLHWTRASLCGLQDYVPVETMENVYLTGLGFPTQGELQGCKIRAEGYYYKGFDNCRVFNVQNLTASCQVSVTSP